MVGRGISCLGRGGPQWQMGQEDPHHGQASDHTYPVASRDRSGQPWHEEEREERVLLPCISEARCFNSDENSFGACISESLPKY